MRGSWRRGRGGELARERWEEIKGRARRGKVLGGGRRKGSGFLRREDGQWEGVELIRGRGELRGEELVCRGRRLEEVERWERIRDSRYNRWYGSGKSSGGAGIPEEGVG